MRHVPEGMACRIMQCCIIDSQMFPCVKAGVERYTVRIVMLMCSLVCGLMVYLTPWQMDDLAYSIQYRAEIMSGSFSFSRLWDFIVWHWQYVNGRIGDKTLLFWLAMAPKWLLSLAATVACYSIYSFAGKIVFNSLSRHVAGHIMLIAAITFFLPWGTYMFITNMFVNYVMGLAFVMPSLYIFVRGDDRDASLAKCLMAGVLGFLSGAWHEVYSVAILPGMVVFCLLMSKGGRIQLQYAVMAGTAVGLLFILITPGFWMRIYNTQAMSCRPITGDPEALKNIMIGLGLNALFIPCFIISISLKSWRRKLDKTAFALSLMCVIMLVVTVAIYFQAARWTRTFFYFDGVAIVAGAMLLRPVCCRFRGWGVRAIVALTIMLIAAHSALILALQYRLKREHDEIVRAYVASPDGVVYHDFHGNGLGPVFALRKARACNFYGNQDNYMRDFYRGDSVRIQLIPKVLQNFDPEAESRKGRLRREGLSMVYEGLFVTTDSAILSKRMLYPSFRMTEGDTLRASMVINRFKDEHGREWAYLAPDMRHLHDRTPVEIVAW